MPRMRKRERNRDRETERQRKFHNFVLKMKDIKENVLFCQRMEGKEKGMIGCVMLPS
jgi:hypothetical protein